jgi:hypothetical protein
MAACGKPTPEQTPGAAARPSVNPVDASTRRPLEQLLDVNDPGWPVVEQMIARATNKVEILPVERADGERTLLAIQVTTRSPMGAIAYQTGGLLVDHGWIRILGGGHQRLPRTLATWNFPDSDAAQPRLPGGFLIADDVLGGFFALDGGAFGGNAHRVFYFAPDALRWEDLGRGYTEFLDFVLAGDLAKFYAGQRWRGWQDLADALAGDRAFDFYPMLFARSDGGIESRQRRDAPLDEIWRAYVGRR